MKRSLLIGGEIREFGEAIVMAIINLTPDSFHSGSRAVNIKDALGKCTLMLAEGADIIDLGAYSSRPGAFDISEDEEIKRLTDVLKSIRKEFPKAILSVDTFRSNVARVAAGEGVDMINDISGGNLDKDMMALVASLRLPYVLMHMHGNPQNMMTNTKSDNITGDLYLFFSKKLQMAREAGIHDIILDVGFGFGKSLENNYKLLKSLSEFKSFGCMLLAGISRKSMAGKVAGTNPDESLPPTIALNTIALLNGADILRVHDVKAARDAVKIVSYYQNL